MSQNDLKRLDVVIAHGNRDSATYFGADHLREFVVENFTKVAISFICIFMAT